jgi:hypothetical protein
LSGSSSKVRGSVPADGQRGEHEIGEGGGWARCVDLGRRSQRIGSLAVHADSEVVLVALCRDHPVSRLCVDDRGAATQSGLGVTLACKGGRGR